MDPPSQVDVSGFYSLFPVDWASIGASSVDEVIKDVLWIGDSDSPAVLGRRVCHVISVCLAQELSDELPAALAHSEARHTLCCAADSPKQPMKAIFERTYRIISRARARGEPVLVHCAAGMSRSASVVMYYLLRSGHCATLQEAYALVHKARPCVCPNEGFLRQLMGVRAETRLKIEFYVDFRAHTARVSAVGTLLTRMCTSPKSSLRSHSMKERRRFFITVGLEVNA